ncbi:C2H2 and C2HC zinc finger [Glarea lozoyensis ATCC 20868]|uniref:C2H2 and C2HC zinc finger n=1 Tax=Glarea lozoyensis (strain ATCC 20868 / MF5171) TaxID=1116229 RepID=S3EDZ2_GLAL2|nr:C2H2 and C2HC zinc finger [Glarea lozoyensis ATCC 20868]EPE36498.1 C2H2 and C2HC zinc finger [Glarea lozoyensis ATCC 20868]
MSERHPSIIVPISAEMGEPPNIMHNRIPQVLRNHASPQELTILSQGYWTSDGEYYGLSHPTPIDLTTLPRHEVSQNACPYCRLLFSSHQAFRTHIEYIHMKIRPSSCEACYFWSFSAAYLRVHCARAHDATTFKCEFCGYISAVPYQLRRHKKSHHRAELDCVECGEFFMTKAALEEHAAKTHVDPRRNFKCVVCELNMSTLEGLRAHCWSNEHKDMVIVKERKKRREASANAHFCEVCSQSFASQNELSLHTSSVHAPELSFGCKTCCRSYTSSSGLARHMKTQFHDNVVLNLAVRARKKEKAGIEGWEEEIPESVMAFVEEYYDIQDIRCDVCPMIFATQWALFCHQMDHNHYGDFEELLKTMPGVDGSSEELGFGLADSKPDTTDPLSQILFG